MHSPRPVVIKLFIGYPHVTADNAVQYSAPAKEELNKAIKRRGKYCLMIVAFRCFAFLSWIMCFQVRSISAFTAQTPSILGSYQDSVRLSYADGIAYDVSLLSFLSRDTDEASLDNAPNTNSSLCNSQNFHTDLRFLSSLSRQESRGYAFVTSYWADAVTVVDVRSNVTNPSLVGYFSSSTYLNGAHGIIYDVSFLIRCRCLHFINKFSIHKTCFARSLARRTHRGTFT